MKLNYIKSQSSVKPDLVDATSSKVVVYLRQNIVENIKTDEMSGEETVFYEYDEAKLTKQEYQEYLKEINGSDTLQTIENLKAENQNLNEQVSMLTECLLEMSETVYAQKIICNYQNFIYEQGGKINDGNVMGAADNVREEDL